MKVHYTRIPAPSRKESIILRIMVVIGVGSLIYFMRQVFLPGHKGYPPLYIPLVFTLAYMCLKYLHEWYHYFNISAPPVLHETGQPAVDIFTTYCSGEPLSMLETTLKAISQLN
ncbi:MAG TPA: hypothetical protein VHK91_01040, partial [Flavisolibacter sp.]|nr:hypothetical protein [Flavisolibacter sp.]